MSITRVLYPIAHLSLAWKALLGGHIHLERGADIGRGDWLKWRGLAHFAVTCSHMRNVLHSHFNADQRLRNMDPSKLFCPISCWSWSCTLHYLLLFHKMTMAHLDGVSVCASNQLGCWKIWYLYFCECCLSCKKGIKLKNLYPGPSTFIIHASPPHIALILDLL